MNTVSTFPVSTFPLGSESHRIGFDIPNGFHGRGDGSVIELDDLFRESAAHFMTQRIWVSPFLLNSLVEAILKKTLPTAHREHWPHEYNDKGICSCGATQGDLKTGPVVWSYRAFADRDPIPFYIDADIRSNRLVLEGVFITR